MSQTPQGWVGALINNAAAQEWDVKNNEETGMTSLKSTAIGGVGNIFFVMGQSPNELIQNYHQHIIGTPTLSPQWALGWGIDFRFQCHSLNNLTGIMDNYLQSIKGNNPFDNVFVDEQILNNSHDFTFDESAFPKFSEFVDELNKQNMHYIHPVLGSVPYRPDEDFYR